MCSVWDKEPPADGEVCYLGLLGLTLDVLWGHLPQKAYPFLDGQFWPPHFVYINSHCKLGILSRNLIGSQITLCPCKMVFWRQSAIIASICRCHLNVFFMSTPPVIGPMAFHLASTQERRKLKSMIYPIRQLNRSLKSKSKCLVNTVGLCMSTTYVSIVRKRFDRKM